MLFALLSLGFSIMAVISATKFWRGKAKDRLWRTVNWSVATGVVASVQAWAKGGAYLDDTGKILILLIVPILGITFYVVAAFGLGWIIHMLMKLFGLGTSKIKSAYDSLPDGDKAPAVKNLDEDGITQTSNGWLYNGEVYPTKFSARAAKNRPDQVNL